MSWHIKAGQNNFFYNSSLVILGLLAITSFLPEIRATSLLNLVWPVLTVLWIFCVALFKPAFFSIVSIHKLICYIYFLYVLTICYATGNVAIGNRYFEFLQIIIFMWAFELANSIGKVSDLRKVLAFVSPIIIFTSVKTILAYANTPNISRTAKKDTDYGLEQMSQGVGGYEFIYMLLFICIPLLYCVFRQDIKGRYFRLFLMLVTLLFAYNILMSNFSTALLILTVAFFFRVFFKNFGPNGFLLVGLVIGVTIPLIIVSLVPVLDFLISLMDNSINAKRLGEIKLLLTSGIADASIGARFDAFFHSIETVYKNPVTGIVVKMSPEDVLRNIGQHSFLFDTFAFFGFFVGLVHLFVFIKPLWATTMGNKQRNLAFSISMFFLSIIFFTVNNLTPSIGFAIYFIMPVLMFSAKRGL